MEQENGKPEFANFTHELTPEYIKGKIDKVVSCSSGPDLFCEIFDPEQNSIMVSELVEKYYRSFPRDKNAENGTFSEEQQKEQELSSVGQKESYSVHSEEKIDEKEQGISNYKLEDYSCYYCDYMTYVTKDYERHVVNIHHLPAYPNKAEIEKRGLKAQGKDWER
jgi:hypothetical protein